LFDPKFEPYFNYEFPLIYKNKNKTGEEEEIYKYYSAIDVAMEKNEI